MTPGDELFRAEYVIRRDDLAAYAAASGDHNPIHLDDDAARAAGLPGVIAHGMYTMGLAARALTEWTQDPGRITALTARFAKPVPVPSGDDGTTVNVTGTVRNVLPDGSVEVNLVARNGDEKVLAPARAIVAPS